jgi:hypothetical protein
MRPIIYFSHFSGMTDFPHITAWLEDRKWLTERLNVRLYDHTEIKVFVVEPSTVSFRVIPSRKRLGEGLPHLFKRFENVVDKIIYRPFSDCGEYHFHAYSESTLRIKVETGTESLLFKFRMKLWRGAYLNSTPVPYFDRSYAWYVKKREADYRQWMITRPESELQLAPFRYPH